MLSSSVKILTTFDGMDGEQPSEIVASGTTLYGTVGGDSSGAIFTLPITGGTPTLLESFDGTDGDGAADLIVSGQTLYGITRLSDTGTGEIFSLPISGGTPTALASFDGTPPSDLILSGNTLYGLDGEEIFSLQTSGGTPTVLASFVGTGESDPVDIAVSGSTLYGTTIDGGTAADGTIFSLPTSGGTPNVLANLVQRVDGEDAGSLVVSGNTIFGSTSNEAATGDGTIFSLPTSGGTPTVLEPYFANGGGEPGGLILSSQTLYCTTAISPGIYSLPASGGVPTQLGALDGYPGDVLLSGNTLYGTIPDGGANSDGEVFALPLNLLPSTISLTSSHVPVYQGQHVTLTVTVTPASNGTSIRTGTVTFFDNNVQIGSAQMLPNGTASFNDTTLPIGNHPITATYSGDTNFAFTTTAASPLVVTVRTVPAGGILAITSATTSASTHGLTISASVVATDSGGAAGLTYTWTAARLPPGAKTPTFNANGTNAANNIIPRFSKAGGYVLQCEVKNAAGSAVTAYVSVTVSQKPTSLKIEPHGAHIPKGATEHYAGTVLDQFGHAMWRPQTLTFLVEAGAGPISPTGLFSATSIAGPVTIELESDALTATVGAVVA